MWNWELSPLERPGALSPDRLRLWATQQGQLQYDCVGLRGFSLRGFWEERGVSLLRWEKGSKTPSCSGKKGPTHDSSGSARVTWQLRSRWKRGGPSQRVPRQSQSLSNRAIWSTWHASDTSELGPRWSPSFLHWKTSLWPPSLASLLWPEGYHDSWWWAARVRAQAQTNDMRELWVGIAQRTAVWSPWTQSRSSATKREAQPSSTSSWRSAKGETAETQQNQPVQMMNKCHGN